jgi:hypothetical protein
MNRRIGALAVRSGLLAAALAALVPQAGLATTTSVDVFASWGNTSPGIRRNTTGTGPLADTVADVSGGSFATGSASVDTFGLHAVATATSDISSPGFTAMASAGAGLVNSFTIVPRAGFTGTHALVDVPYSFGGSFLSHPSLAACATCFGAVDVRLSVDGLAQSFFFVGAHSQGTMGNANFVAGGVTRAGVLQGLLPVNTPLFLRAGLTTNVHCQSDSTLTCGMEAQFGGALSYTGLSLDDVDIVWGLVPTLVPEPTSSALLGLGLLALPRLRRGVSRASHRMRHVKRPSR